MSSEMRIIDALDARAIVTVPPEIVTDKTHKEKIPLPGKKRAFIKIYSDIDSGQVASVIIGLANWVECFPALATKFPSMHKNILGFGGLYYDKHTESYYCSGTEVQPKYRGQGHGISLYKVLLMAAREHAKLRRRGGIVRFSPHQAVGSSTSESAWRCYRSLAKKGYLKMAEDKPCQEGVTRDDIFIAQKYPLRINPTVLVL